MTALAAMASTDSDESVTDRQAALVPLASVLLDVSELVL